MTAARIPPKGHPNRYKYWRHRRLMEEARETAKGLAEAATKESNPTRRLMLEAAARSAAETASYIETAWRVSYLEEPK